MKKLMKVEYLSRVEGEAGLYAEIQDGEISRVEFKVFEAPRFFEAFLRGRSYQDIIDFTARICGICPVAYQMSAVHAIEKIFGVETEKPVKELRRLLYTGEWIESHALHVYLLQGPDFYKAESAWTNKEYLPFAKRGLFFKKLGNQLLEFIGGRSIHPVSVKVGGFYRVPVKKEMCKLLDDYERAYEEALKAISWAARLPFGTSTSWDTEQISLRHGDEYPMNEGRVFSSKGLDMSMDAFMSSIRERHVEYSTALRSDRPYLVGPVSRFNLNHDTLPQEIKDAVRESGVSIPISDVRMGIIARSVEIAYAFHEALRIIREYEEPGSASADFSPRSGTATWITEAPRGMLIHRYTLNERGYVKECAIVPPTSQNLVHAERDICHFLKENSGKPVERLKKECEGIIRSYDPCISCSVHLLELQINEIN